MGYGPWNIVYFTKQMLCATLSKLQCLQNIFCCTDMDLGPINCFVVHTTCFVAVGAYSLDLVTCAVEYMTCSTDEATSAD